MQYTREDVSTVKKKFTITVPAQEVDAAIDESIDRMRGQIALKGFRRGKAPRAVVEARFKDSVYSGVLERLVTDHYDAILKETSFKPVSGVSFDNQMELHRGTELTYAINFEIMPEFELPEEFEPAPVEAGAQEVLVSDEDVQQQLNDILRSRAGEKPLDEERSPREGDLVVVDFQAYTENGVEIPGLSATDYSIAIGNNEVVKDLENLICTIKVGEKTKGKVDFLPPKDGEESKSYEVELTLKKHSEIVLPELTDEFVRLLGEFKSVEELKNHIRVNLGRSKEQDQAALDRDAILEHNMMRVEFEVPESLVERQIGRMAGEFYGPILQNETDPEKRNEIVESLKKELWPSAEKTVRAHMFLQKIAEKQGFKVSKEEVEEHMQKYAEQTNRPLEEIRNQHKKPEAWQALYEHVLTGKALSYLLSQAFTTKAKRDGISEEELSRSLMGQAGVFDLPKLNMEDAINKKAPGGAKKTGKAAATAAGKKEKEANEAAPEKPKARAAAKKTAPKKTTKAADKKDEPKEEK